ncbi:MAG: ATP-binding protein [Bdellovibrionaceae bacterium]|nr:ATP-binding protein [Pseudobdellovibrionaceae bacterium]
MSAERLFRGEAVFFQAVASAAEAKELLSQQTYAVIVADQRLQKSSGIDLLEYAKQHAPATTRILLTGFVDSGVIEEAVNRGAVFRFINKPWDNDELSVDITKAIEHHRLKITQAGLLREVTRQNRRLEEMTSGLEKLVAERTTDAETSKVEAEHGLTQMRELVRFIKDLSTLTSIDELMNLVAKEVRAFAALRPPVLGYVASERRPMIVYFQGKQVVEKEMRHAWSMSVRLRINEIDDRVYLANEFGRPFVKVIAIPLKRRMAALDSDPEPPATLFFEHTLSDDKIEPFLTFISERLQPLSIALDRILLEYHLKYTSYQWESTFDGIKDPIAIVDMEYSVVRANRHFHGGSFEATCHKIFAGQDTVCRGCPVQSALSSGAPQISQIRRGPRTYEVHSYPIRIEGDEVVTNVIHYYVDVTSARELHGRVVQSEKMAAIGLLAGNIAHELNNPLTGIRSLSQVLLAELPAQTQLHGDIVEVEKAAARSQKIIENLLDFSRGGHDDRQVPVSLNEIVSRTLPMLKTAMREHRSELYLCEDQVNVRVEPQLMQQVVFNLVNNACQAMTDNGTITIETLVSPDGACELRVSDTGIGIPVEIRETIFEPFFTTKEEGKGTGLGLSMSKNVIEKFGGEISVQSEAGQGATFIVKLPRVGAAG